MRRALAVLLLLSAIGLQAATDISVGNNVVVSQVKRFGVSGVSHFYYDRVLLKNLIWRNAGFEGLLFQAVVRCESSLSPTGCVDSNQYTAWPTGFWNGATYDFILGTAKGRSGDVASSTAPVAPNGTGWTFADSGITPAQGDYFVARKYTGGGADLGWTLAPLGGASYATETSDIPPNSDGRQCLRLTADGQGQSINLTNGFGSFAGQTFVLMNGTYRISFKAKGTGGSNRVAVSVRRDPNTMTSQTVTLTPSWASYNLDFSAAENGIPPGFVSLNFNLAGASMLIDDVSLSQTNGDPANTTAFRDPVVSALRSLNPGILRSHQMDQGDSIDDLLAPPFGRLRTEYHASATNKTTNQYGLHEFLELCELLGAEPWLVLPITMSDAEVSNVMEYLGGPTTSPYGSRRATRGHPTPWTDRFARIHLEFGNEAWNSVFLGATMFAADYGRRGSEVFGVVHASPYYSAKFNLILGVQASAPGNTLITHNASANHDMLGVGPYIATRIDDFADNEQLFGGLFAEASWWSKSPSGLVKQTYDNINASSRPVPLIVYEVNLHTTQGSITQPVLDSFTPSIGAGLAVADHMLNMLREQRVREQLIFSLAGYRYDRDDGKTSLIWGVSRDLGVTDRRRPQHLAIQLINEALSGDLVGTTHTGDNPLWNQPLTNRIAMNDVPYLQSFAFVNGSRRAVILFNLHRTSSLDVTLSGPNAPAGAVTMKRLSAAAITDNNENSVAVSITTTQIPSFDGSQTMSLPPFSMTLLLSTPAPPSIPGRVRAVGRHAAVDLQWDPSTDATAYEILRTASGSSAQTLATVSVPAYTDLAVDAHASYLYRVRAVGPGGVSAYSDPDLGTATTFSDDPIISGLTVVRSAHLAELRSAATAARAVAGLPAPSWTDPTLVPGLTLIRASHLLELRNALFEALDLMGVTRPQFGNLAAGTTVASRDIQDLRTALQ